MNNLKYIDCKPNKKLYLELSKLKTQEKIYVSNGWIDSHIHLVKNLAYFLDKDKWDDNKGVTCFIDAGSVGAKNLKLLEKHALNNKIKIFSLLNIAPYGLKTKNELKGLRFNEKKHIELLDKPYVVGSKVRLSKSVLDQDLESYKNAIIFLSKLSYPTMFHVGSTPPSLLDIKGYIKENDLITHYSHGKNDDARLFFESGAKVYKDVGFGIASFSIKQYKKLIKNNFTPDVISTDLHNSAFKNTTLRLNKIMSLFLEIGLSLEDVIKCVTKKPYSIFLKNKFPEYINEHFTIFKVLDKQMEIIDSEGEIIKINKVIEPIAMWTESGGLAKC